MMREMRRQDRKLEREEIQEILKDQSDLLHACVS